MERKCMYRNCDKDISNMRSDAKYCSRNCKGCESKYIRRRKLLIEKYKQNELKRIKDYIDLTKIIENQLKGGQ